MILLVNICKEELHSLEFVEPIESILENLKIDFFVKRYKEISEDDLKKADKIIICGTSLKDNQFSGPQSLKYFSWIKNFNKPLLGICGGMQVIGLIFGGRLKQQKEIGFFFEKFKNEFLGLKGELEVYHLHNYFIDFGKLREFEIFSINDKHVVQAVKYEEKNIYGVLFHPEVRQKKMIENFCDL